MDDSKVKTKKIIYMFMHPFILQLSHLESSKSKAPTQTRASEDTNTNTNVIGRLLEKGTIDKVDDASKYLGYVASETLAKYGVDKLPRTVAGDTGSTHPTTPFWSIGSVHRSIHWSTHPTTFNNPPPSLSTLLQRRLSPPTSDRAEHARVYVI